MMFALCWPMIVARLPSVPGSFLTSTEMRAVAPAGVSFVDGGPGIARRVVALTQGQEWPRDPTPHRLVFTHLGEREARIGAHLRAHGFAAPETL